MSKPIFILLRGKFESWKDYLGFVLPKLGAYKMEDVEKLELTKEGIYVHKRAESFKASDTPEEPKEEPKEETKEWGENVFWN